MKTHSQGHEAQLDSKLNSADCIKTSIPEAKEEGYRTVTHDACPTQLVLLLISAMVLSELNSHEVLFHSQKHEPL